MSIPKPRPQPLYMRCAQGHEWEEWWPQPMLAEAFIARLQNCLCPECATRKVFLRQANADEALNPGFVAPDS